MKWKAGNCAPPILPRSTGAYELNVEVLMRLHELSPRAGLAAAAFEAAERARARSLLDNLAQAGVDLHNGVDPDFLKRESAAKKGFMTGPPGAFATQDLRSRPKSRPTAIWRIPISRSRRKSAAEALAMRR